MSTLAILVGKETREQWRTMRLLVVGGVFAVVGISSPLLARYTRDIVRAAAGGGLASAMPNPTVADALDQLAKNVGQLGAVIAIVVAMGAVALEKERGTAAFVLSRPAGRGTYLASKLIAIGLLLAFGVAIAGTGAWVYTAILFEPLAPAGFAAACGLLWLLLMTYAAVTFLASTVAPSAVVAAGVGFAWLIVGGILGAIPGLGSWFPTSLLGPARSLAVGTSVGNLAQPVAGSLAIIAGALVVAWLAFRRQEL